MNILIIGEYSGFSKNLCKGFTHLDYNVCVISWGDVFKNIRQEEGSIDVDISNYRFLNHSIKGSHYVKQIFSYLKLMRQLKKMQNKFDFALILNPIFVKCGVNLDAYPNLQDIQKLLKNPQNIFLSACGNDFIFNSYLSNRKKTSDYYREFYAKFLKVDRRNFENVISHVLGVIPVMADYAYAYRFFEDSYKYKIYNTIPLPFDCHSVSYTFEDSDKVSIMHGITRPKEKGSDYIIRALEKIKAKYSDIVDIKLVSRLPLSEYLTIMNGAHIIIDQCYAWSYGMNTIEALSMGKVVLSGNEPENTKEFGVKSCPVININSDSDEIYSILENLILHRDTLKEISRESRRYALQLHDCKIVAQKYIDVFKEQMA